VTADGREPSIPAMDDGDAAPAPVETVVSIALAALVDCPLRKRRDLGDLDELAASMRTRGVLQPLVVRARRGRFEVIIGGRRFHAASRAGLAGLPCIVRELSDQEALAAFIVSKIQRAGLHPLDEGEAYRELRETHGWSVTRIAKETGRSAPTIYSRLKLLELAPLPWEALVDGRLSTPLAVIIARIAAPDLQTKATREVLRLDTPGAEAMTFNESVEHIRLRFMLTSLGETLKPEDLFDCVALRCRLAARDMRRAAGRTAEDRRQAGAPAPDVRAGEQGRRVSLRARRPGATRPRRADPGAADRGRCAVPAEVGPAAGLGPRAREPGHRARGSGQRSRRMRSEPLSRSRARATTRSCRSASRARSSRRGRPASG
jgi:ParB/RepB/Spo0J family partition protein